QGGRRSSRADFGRTRYRQVAHHLCLGGAPPFRFAHPPALFLLALPSGLRAVPVYWSARSGGGFRPPSLSCSKAGETRNLAGPGRAARGGCGAPGGLAIITRIGASSATEPQSDAQKGSNARSADPSARRLRAPAANCFRLRGCPLD